MLEQTSCRADGHQRVTHPAEVIGVLNEATRSRVLCSVRAAGRPETYMSRVFALDSAASTLVFDVPRAPVIARALVPGSTAAVEITLDHMRVRFDAAVTRIGPHAGTLSLFVAMPQALVRQQRRESFRIAVPATSAVRLDLNRDDVALTGLRLADLSCGGASLTLSGALDEFPVGRVYEGVRLVLDPDLQYMLDTRVRHAGALRLAGPASHLRIGLQFLNTPAGFESAIAHLIDDIAHGRR